MTVAIREECLTANEVGLWLGVHVNTVKRIPFELLPYFRVTSRGDRRYEPANVHEYIRRRSVPNVIRTDDYDTRKSFICDECAAGSHEELEDA